MHQMGQKIRAKYAHGHEVGRGRAIPCVQVRKKLKTKDANGRLQVYLFSDHLGLLVNLLPVGDVTQEVMALCS